MRIGRLEPERFAEFVAAREQQDHYPASSLCLACTDVLDVSGVAGVADALELLRAYAFSRDRSISDVAADVSAGVVRFDEPEL